MEDAYLKVLEEHLKNTPFSRGLHVIQIIHDDDCGFFIGDVCNCEAEVRSGPMVDEAYGIVDDEAGDE